MDWMRLIVSFLSGGLLAISGSLIQGVAQNDLAGPATLGFNALVVLIILISHGLVVLVVPDFPLEYLSLSMFLSVNILLYVYILKKKPKRIYGNSVGQNISFYILLGLCFNLFVGAIFSFVQFLFMSMNVEFPSQLWFGNFRYVDEFMSISLILFSIVTYYIVIKLSKKMRILSFGIDYAEGLGIRTNKIQVHALMISLLSVGVVISLFGVFAFMGLVFPHLLRFVPFFKYNIKNEITYGPIVCGLFFMILDQLCANFPFYGAEIPVGMVSSIIGTFLFMYLLIVRELKKTV